MKRAIAILLTFLLVLSSAGALASESYYIGTMRVVNCEEWVSLRVEPSISSDYVDTVPLGAVVYAYYYNEEFTRCYYYGWGYIKNEYLTIEEAYNPTGLGSVERAFGESGFWELYPDYEAFDLPYANTTHTGGWIEAQYLFSTGSRQYTQSLGRSQPGLPRRPSPPQVPPEYKRRRAAAATTPVWRASSRP